MCKPWHNDKKNSKIKDQWPINRKTSLLEILQALRLQVENLCLWKKKNRLSVNITYCANNPHETPGRFYCPCFTAKPANVHYTFVPVMAHFLEVAKSGFESKSSYLLPGLFCYSMSPSIRVSDVGLSLIHLPDRWILDRHSFGASSTWLGGLNHGRITVPFSPSPDSLCAVHMPCGFSAHRTSQMCSSWPVFVFLL